MYKQNEEEKKKFGIKENEENRQRQSLIETQIQKRRPPYPSKEEQSPKASLSGARANPRRQMRKEKSVLRQA
jgi:hypothetical protein